MSCCKHILFHPVLFMWKPWLYFSVLHVFFATGLTDKRILLLQIQKCKFRSVTIPDLPFCLCFVVLSVYPCILIKYLCICEFVLPTKIVFLVVLAPCFFSFFSIWYFSRLLASYGVSIMPAFGPSGESSCSAFLSCMLVWCFNSVLVVLLCCLFGRCCCLPLVPALCQLFGLNSMFVDSWGMMHILSLFFEIFSGALIFNQ